MPCRGPSDGSPQSDARARATLEAGCAWAGHSAAAGSLCGRVSRSHSQTGAVMQRPTIGTAVQPAVFLPASCQARRCATTDASAR